MFLAWCCKCKLQYTEQLLSLNTNCYNSEDQSETMHNILFVYKTANILDNKMCIASKGLQTCPQTPCTNMPMSSGAHDTSPFTLYHMKNIPEHSIHSFLKCQKV